ncbi:hypothetical protein ACFX2I_023746 [Malus domestica]
MQARSVGVVCSFNSCRQGASGAVLQFQLVQARSIWCRVAVSARAGQERRAMQFRLVQARSFGLCSLGSCEQGALVRAV